MDDASDFVGNDSLSGIGNDTSNDAMIVLGDNTYHLDSAGDNPR